MSLPILSQELGSLHSPGGPIAVDQLDTGVSPNTILEDFLCLNYDAEGIDLLSLVQNLLTIFESSLLRNNPTGMQGGDQLDALVSPNTIFSDFIATMYDSEPFFTSAQSLVPGTVLGAGDVIGYIG